MLSKKASLVEVKQSIKAINIGKILLIEIIIILLQKVTLIYSNKLS